MNIQGRILLFYKYVDITYPQQILKWQRKICTDLGLTGRIILATEGINGTISGSIEHTERYKAIMDKHPLFGAIDFKESIGDERSFPRMRIVVKDEIVHLGIDKQRYHHTKGGIHLSPDATHKLLSEQPDNLVIIDCRNQFESEIGTIKGSIRPETRYFREFPDYIDHNAKEFDGKQVLMFCTGGIRCERASAYVKETTNAEKVFQIKGGIHRYTEQYPDGFFRGKNYVFDNRIAVKVNDDVLSSCALCSTPCDDYTNCINTRCNKQYISCSLCLAKLHNTCSAHCYELIATKQAAVRPDYTGPIPTEKLYEQRS